MSDKEESECDPHDESESDLNDDGISDDGSMEDKVTYPPKKKVKTNSIGAAGGVSSVVKAPNVVNNVKNVPKIVKEKAPRAKSTKPSAVKKDVGSSKAAKPGNSKSKAVVGDSDETDVITSINISSSSNSSSSSSSSYLTNANQQPQQDITRGPDINTEAAAKKLILLYLRQQNRPYSAIQIYDNLHKRITKPLIERVLNAICAANDCDLICKEYGKAKIYFIDQNTMTSNYTPAELDALIHDNSELKKEVDAAVGEERRYKQQLQALMDEPSDDALDRLMTEATNRINEKNSRISRLQSSSSIKGGDSRIVGSLLEAVKAFNYYRTMWLNRKQLCMDAVDLLSEGTGKKMKDIMAEMCIETDEDAAVSVCKMMPEPR